MAKTVRPIVRVNDWGFNENTVRQALYIYGVASELGRMVLSRPTKASAAAGEAHDSPTAACVFGRFANV